MRHNCRRVWKPRGGGGATVGGGGGGLGGGRPPGPARVPRDPLPQALTNTSSRPTWASTADQGVRPTLHSFSCVLAAGPRFRGSPCHWRVALAIGRRGGGRWCRRRVRAALVRRRFYRDPPCGPEAFGSPLA